MNKQFPIIILVVLLLGACSKDEQVPQDNSDNRVNITGYTIFSDGVGLTRSADTTLLHTSGFNSTDEMNVYTYNNGKLFTAGVYRAKGTNNELTAETPVYWPASGTSDIMAYYPKTVTNTTTSFTVKYNQSNNVDYKASDLMVSYKTNQSKASNYEQTLNFSHKLARVKVVVSCGEGFSATMKEIRMMNVYRTIGFNPSTGEIEAEILSNKGNIIMQTGGTATSMTAVALVPPQTIDADNKLIEIDTSEGTAKYNPVIKYNNTIEETVTKLILEKGKSYTINLTLTKSNLRVGATFVVWEEDSEENMLAYFNYTGNEQQFVVPTDGSYSIKAWGAQGGSVNTMQGGYGGYAESKVQLTAGQILYVSVGGAGDNGGWNGGGIASSSGFASGGGASHVATVSGLRSEIHLDDMLVIAGGGGGASSSHAGGNGCDEYCGGYLAGNGVGQSAENLPGGGGGNQGGRNDADYAFGGSGYTLKGTIAASTHTGNGIIRISILK